MLPPCQTRPRAANGGDRMAVALVTAMILIAQTAAETSRTPALKLDGAVAGGLPGGFEPGRGWNGEARAPPMAWRSTSLKGSALKLDDDDASVFDVVWNSDLSLHCQAINQTLRLGENGVRANAGQAWFGGAINTIYGAGLSMPSAAGPNGSFLNGGIPQLADRTLIKSATEALLRNALPNDTFTGFGVFDIEYPGLYPLWSFDFGPEDQNVRRLAANWTSSRHPHLAGAALVNQTMADFNAGMRELWQLQLDTAAGLHPRGQFGYYRMPHCWYSNLDPFSPCNGHPEFSNQLAWLWKGEGGVFPGAYFASGSANNSARMLSTVREAVRVAQVHGHGRPAVMPFVSYAYRGGPLDHQLLPPDMMWKMLSIPASLGVDGVVIWGGSDDAKTVNCDALSIQLDAIGPKLKALRESLAQCAASACSGHGRCATWFKPTRCVCEASWAGDRCQHQRATLKTDDGSSTTVFAPRELCVQLPTAGSRRGRAAAEDLLLSELRRRHQMHLPRADDQIQWWSAANCPPAAPTI